MPTAKPRIGITMGDAAGIGPEITAKCLSNENVFDWCAPVVLGDARIMADAAWRAGLSLDVRGISTPDESTPAPGTVDVIDYRNIDPADNRHGQVIAANGDAAVLYTQEAGRMCLDGRLDAMVSAPLNKESMRAAGHQYEGQTEILARLCGASRHAMALILDRLRIMLLTNHLPIAEAIRRVKKDRVVEMIELGWELLRFLHLPDPTLAVSAINPHGGEGGAFGREEIDEIEPAVRECRARGINAAGPFPGDTVFHRAHQGEFDLVLAMYHDQGMAPVKLLGFGHAVTLVAGLPFVRTSVAHGTAFDIAGQNKADCGNLLEAIRVAAELAAARRVEPAPAAQ